MDTKNCMSWVNRKFLFAVMVHTPPGQTSKEISPIKIAGTVTAVTLDERSGTCFIEISTRHVYLHGRVFPIVKQVITIEKNKKPCLYFDSCRVAGNECFSGEFMLTE